MIDANGFIPIVWWYVYLTNPMVLIIAGMAIYVWGKEKGRREMWHEIYDKKKPFFPAG